MLASESDFSNKLVELVMKRIMPMNWCSRDPFHNLSHFLKISSSLVLNFLIPLMPVHIADYQIFFCKISKPLGLQKSWQTQKVLKRIWQKSNYEAMLKNIFCNTSIEFLKATFWRWNLIFATEKNSRFAFVNTFCREFSFQKPCPFEKSDLNKRCIFASSNWLWIWFHFEMEPKPFNLRPEKTITFLHLQMKGIHLKTKDLCGAWNPVLA